MVFAALPGILIPMVDNSMTENEKYLKETQAYAKEFEAELEPERLSEAYRSLENVLWMQERDPKIRAQIRTNSLALWLHLLHTLDHFLDPHFNPKDFPEKLVQPPPTLEGVVYPPGADPALIGDSKERAEYEKAIAANRAKANRYRLQINLRRLDERISPRAEAFVRDCCIRVPNERGEITTAIEKTIKSPVRQARLLRACFEKS